MTVKLVDNLENTIIENIREIPEVPISLLLSGGIDSSLILALIRKVYPNLPISTFTLAKSGDYPDIIYAREVAKLFNTRHNEIIISDREQKNFKDQYDKIRRYNFKGDVNVYILCSYAREYSRVIVTGDGGDECFGGYWLHENPLGHKESGKIRSFEEIHPKAKMYLKEMFNMGFRDFLFKEKSQKEDYNTVWEYFIEIMAPQHLAPLLHTASILQVEIYTPLFSKRLINFIRNLPYTKRVSRKIEKELALLYLPKSIIERESIGFDAVLR